MLILVRQLVEIVGRLLSDLIRLVRYRVFNSVKREYLRQIVAKKEPKTASAGLNGILYVMYGLLVRLHHVEAVHHLFHIDTFAPIHIDDSSWQKEQNNKPGDLLGE